MAEEEEGEEVQNIDVAINNYVPSILPQWQNHCQDEVVYQEAKTIELTDENAPQYAEIASNVGWKGRIKYALDHLEKDSSLDDNLLGFLLENLISTIMVLAKNGTPPDDYLYSSFTFLEHIRNEFGEHPPNIAAFIEYFQAKANPDARTNLEYIAGFQMDDKLPPNLIITQVPKSVQQRLCTQKRN